MDAKNIEELIREGSGIAKEKKAEEKKLENVYKPSKERIRDLHMHNLALEEWLEGWLVGPKSLTQKGLILKSIFKIKMLHKHMQGK